MNEFETAREDDLAHGYNPPDGAIEAMMEDEFSKACHVLFADPEIVKYTEVESAPTAHGLFVTTSAGTTYEVNITRKA